MNKTVLNFREKVEGRKIYRFEGITNITIGNHVSQCFDGYVIVNLDANTYYISKNLKLKLAANFYSELENNFPLLSQTQLMAKCEQNVCEMILNEAREIDKLFSYTKEVH